MQPERSFPCLAQRLCGRDPDLSRPAVQPNLLPAEPRDRPLPINLAAALRLSDARPLVVAAAQARIQIAAAQLEKAAVLWLPNVNGGSAYIMHAGGKTERQRKPAHDQHQLPLRRRQPGTARGYNRRHLRAAGGPAGAAGPANRRCKPRRTKPCWPRPTPISRSRRPAARTPRWSTPRRRGPTWSGTSRRWPRDCAARRNLSLANAAGRVGTGRGSGQAAAGKWPAPR